MKIEDVNKFKGVMKSALQDWGEAKIDEMLPGKSTLKALMKNGLNNILARHDEILNKWIDSIFILAADEKGVIDSDSMVDILAGMFNEMPKKEYNYGSFGISAGGGEMVISFPHNFLVDMLVGDSVKLTTEDILDLKGMIV